MQVPKMVARSRSNPQFINFLLQFCNCPYGKNNNITVAAADNLPTVAC